MISLSRLFVRSESDRRRFERLDPEEKFLVEFRKSKDAAFRIGEGRDISQGGLRFATAAPVRKGEDLQVILYFPKQFPGPRSIQGQVRVRRIYVPGALHRSRIACEFKEPQRPLQEVVTEYIHWNKSSILPLS
jgi:PilZ domain